MCARRRGGSCRSVETDLAFDRATGIDQPASRGKLRATAGQKAGQQGAARRRITTHLELANIKKALQTQSFCIEDGIIGTLTIPPQVPPRGAELSDASPGNKPVSKSGGAECGPLEIEIPPDAELVELARVTRGGEDPSQPPFP